MQKKAYNELITKQGQFENIENLIYRFKETIFSFNEDRRINTQITIEADEGGIMYIDYLGRMIKVLFVNNLDGANIDFYLEQLSKYNNGYVYKKIASVESDSLGNVGCKELGITKQLYQSIHFDVLNYIIEKSCLSETDDNELNTVE